MCGSTLGNKAGRTVLIRPVCTTCNTLVSKFRHPCSSRKPIEAFLVVSQVGLMHMRYGNQVGYLLARRQLLTGGVV